MLKFIDKLSYHYLHFTSDSLYRNAGYLLGVNLIGAIISFVFWVVSARIYSQEQIGFASSIISISSFLAIVSGLGVGPGLIRHLSSENDPVPLLKTTIINNLILSLLVGGIYLFISLNNSSKFSELIRNDLIMSTGFIFFLSLMSLSSLVQFSFQGFRESRFAFWHIILWDVLGLLFLVVFYNLGFQNIGIVPIQALSLFIANIISYFYFLPRIIKRYSFKFEYSFGLFSKLLPYSIGSFGADLLYRAPLLVTPMIVLNIVDAKASANVYFAWMMGWMITSPGQSLAASVFSEGSNDPHQLINLITKSLKNAILVTFLISIIIFFISPQLLLIFGKAYSIDAANVLKWLASSAIFVVLNSLYFAILKVNKRIKELISVSLLSALVYLGITIYFLGKVGIVSTGIGWFFSQLIISVFALKTLIVLKNCYEK
jgi:O-antigen/teichoic acid export membrane protein